jgi:hypothetical protein
VKSSRRNFLKQTSGSLIYLPFRSPVWIEAKELRCDAAVIGGGLGGVAAALAVLKEGFRVIMTEETDWIGGQATAQGTPPDEHPWIESFGCTRLYRNYRNAIREYYKRHYPLTEEARAQSQFNPGDATVSRISSEPRVSLAVLEAMLAPHLASGRLTLLLRHRPIAADVQGDAVRSITVRNLDNGNDRQIEAAYFCDATELGDLLPLTRTEYVTGFESRNETGEPHAPDAAQPANMQAFTWCFAVDHLPGETHIIDKPADYDFWRAYVPELKPAWPGKLLDWRQSDPRSLKERSLDFDPTGPNPTTNQRFNLWHYRRIISKQNFQPGAYASDVTVINWPNNDYWLGNLYEVPDEEAARHRQKGKHLSLALLYWLQTEAPRPDGGHGWPGLRLRPDVMGTEDGLTKYPYIRESRRIKAEFTVVEQHVGVEARTQKFGKKTEELTAEIFPDSVGVGGYRIDLHPSSGGDNYIDIGSFPFQIPLGALIPRRVENLLAACKNLGVTHLTNGVYRLHHVEWNIGEAAGACAAQAIQIKNRPRAIRNTPKLLADFQTKLRRQGVETEWPKLRAL